MDAPVPANSRSAARRRAAGPACPRAVRGHAGKSRIKAPQTLSEPSLSLLLLSPDYTAIPVPELWAEGTGRRRRRRRRRRGRKKSHILNPWKSSRCFRVHRVFGPGQVPAGGDTAAKSSTLKITKTTVRSPPLHGCLSLSLPPSLSPSLYLCARSRGCTAERAQRPKRSLHTLPPISLGYMWYIDSSSSLSQVIHLLKKRSLFPSVLFFLINKIKDLNSNIHTPKDLHTGWHVYFILIKYWKQRPFQ